MAEEYVWRVIITRFKTVPNPKYRYYEQTDEPRYLITDETTESVSKVWMRKSDAKRYRTTFTSHGDPDLLKSAIIQKAKIDWQTLAEDEL